MGAGVIEAPDAEFIAAANPAVVLELVAAHRAALARIDRVEALHRPRRTGREEYKLGANDTVIGIEPTFVCASACEPTWYFEGDGCETWRALAGESK